MNPNFMRGKIPEASDTTGLTPPLRMDEQRNERRAQQISHLHQQFFDLKKKIKQIQSKNQRIIDRIHDAYNFKKKNAYTEEMIDCGEDSPVYDHRYDQPFSGALSVDAQSNKSEHSTKQVKLQKRSSQLPMRKQNKNKNINLSVEYGKPEMGLVEDDRLRQAQTQAHFMPGQLPPSYPNTSPSIASVGSRARADRRLVDELSQEKQMLEQELGDKEAQVFKLQSALKSSMRSVKGMLKDSLQQFEEEVVSKNLALIEKALRKYEQKFKGVKTMALRVKDRQEDKKSSRLLEYGRQRRSQSKSRKNSPSKDNSYYARESKVSLSSEMKEESRNKSRVEQDESRSRSRVVEQEKHRREFQQIANKYQQIIKSKTEEIQRGEKKYKAKERQCYEMKMRIEVIQKRLAEYEPERRGQSDSAKKEADSSLVSGSNVDVGLMEEQMQKLQQQIEQLQNTVNEKSNQIVALQGNLVASDHKARAMQEEWEANSAKLKARLAEEEEKYSKELERLSGKKNGELAGLRGMLTAADKKFLEKECEFYALESKLKKMEGLLASKDTKIEELEKLVGENCPSERSMMLSSGVFGGEQPNLEALRKLKEQVEGLENKLEESRTEIFSLTKKANFFRNKCEEVESTNKSLQKQLESAQLENEQLRINANMNNISAVMKQHEEQDSHEDIAHSLSAIGSDEKRQSQVDVQALNAKMGEISKQKEQWYEKYNKIKAASVQRQSENIKLRSELAYSQKQAEDSGASIGKMKADNDALRRDNKELHAKLTQLDELLQQEREDFKLQLNDIERKWLQFQDDMKKSTYQEGDKSERSSVVSYGRGRNNIDLLNTQNEFLTLKLREAEAQVETLRTMEQKIIAEYQSMLEEYKLEGRNKADENRDLKEQIQLLSNKISTLNMKLEVSKSEAGSNSRKEQKNQLIQRIEELEGELKESKEINNKLTDMEGQLFEQIRIKEEENNELYQQLRSKEARIHELEEADPQPEPINTYASHMSQSTHKRDSIKSQSSLKYSSHSQVLRKSRMLSSSKVGLGSSKIGLSSSRLGDQRGFDLQLSQAGSQFYEQPSQISNISQFFQREQLPYEKIKIKRHDQIKLFEKTASYIKSLKKAIDEKNKKIKLLEKKIESLKSSELVRKELGLDIDLKEDRLVTSRAHLEADDTFRDYDSVQLEYKRGGGGYLRRYRQLEHDTKLVMEQNNLLIQQIETLEEELLKAEEQEGSLVKIKDLYKQQIKKLLKKNEQQTKQFEQQLKNQKKRVQQSESIHNIQAIKQLFTKIVQIAGFKFTDDGAGAKKKEEKRKELQEYVKVMSNILKLDKKAKDGLLAVIHK